MDCGRGIQHRKGKMFSIRTLLRLGNPPSSPRTRVVADPESEHREGEPLDQRPFSEILAHADKMRDARRWGDAAIAYRHVVEREPDLAPIWVQLGHALKESGDQIEAEVAYRRAIHLAPDMAENHLQLGHLLKLGGRRREAINAFADALRVDPGFRTAAAELTGMGVRWQARSSTIGGNLPLHETLAALDEIRRSLASIEAQLPDLASLATNPVDDYDAFRHKFSVSLPPKCSGAGATLSIVVLDTGESGVSDILHLCHSLECQTLSPRDVTFLTTKYENAQCFNRLRAASNPQSGAARLVKSSRETWQRILEIAPLTPSEWILLVPGNLSLHPAALAWFSFASSFGAVALYPDEDHLSFRSDGQNRFDRPVFKTAFDPLLLEQGGSFGDVIAIRRDVLNIALPSILKQLTSSDQPASISIGVLLRRVAGHGPVAHIPRVLASRLSSVEVAAPRTDNSNPNMNALPVGSPNRILVVVPTRNEQTNLISCINSLREKAHHSNRLKFIIIDNGSDDSDTLSYLKTLQRTGDADVIRDNRPFNWSLFNNMAAEGSEADLFVFCNNDIEMLSDNWDLYVEKALSEESIGALGAKLLYSDMTVQHAGIVFGPKGQCEHEGVNQPSDAPGPQGRWVLRRRVGAVTGAFLACRADVFRMATGFDVRELPIWFGDIDFCLRLRAQGKHILFEPAICAIHHESKTVRAVLSGDISQQYWSHALQVMRKRWGRAMVEDPSFNPYFSRWDPPFLSITEPPLDAILAHLSRSASPNPWRVQRNQDNSVE